MSVKVELGFTSAGASAPFFTLDEVLLGVLDSPFALLGGGEIMVDVSAFFKAFSITRGKSRELDRFGAGQATVSFTNNDRSFDPTFAASPFFGQIEPRRQLRITVDSVIVFEGTVDDWNIEYETGGTSVAVCQAFDGFANLANLDTEALTLTEGFTNQQLNEALDNILWPADRRDIALGNALLSGQAVADGTNILGLMQRMADSEPGDLFVSKSGSIKFVDRNTSFRVGGVVLSDSSGIGYQDIRVVFGSELLYNSVMSRNLTTEAISTSPSSISLFGKRDIIRDTFLENTSDLAILSDFLVSKYDTPEYRFDALSVNLGTVTSQQRADLIALELGDVIEVQFTPSGIPPQIERYGKVIRLSQRADANVQILEIGLEAVAGALLVLDDLEFGKLDLALIGW